MANETRQAGDADGPLDAELPPIEPQADSVGDARTKMRLAMHAPFFYAGMAAERMVALYNKAFRLDSGYRAEYYKSVGVSHAQKGRHEKAIGPLEMALAITPDDPEVLRHLGRACYACERLGEAKAHLTKALKTGGKSAGALFLMGMIYSREGDYDRAIVYFTKVAELEPEHAEAHYRLGVAFDNKKRYKAAITYFRKAIRLDPRNSKAHQALGFAYESTGDRESAVTCFKKALELD